MTKNKNGIDDLFSDLEKDPEFQEAMEELEPGYQITRLRLKKDLTQAQLAELVGTSQSAIARLENGSSPSLSTLRRVAKAMDAHVEVNIISDDDSEEEVREPEPLLNTIEYLHEDVTIHINEGKLFDAQQKLRAIAALIEQYGSSQELKLLSMVVDSEKEIIDKLASENKVISREVV